LKFSQKSQNTSNNLNSNNITTNIKDEKNSKDKIPIENKAISLKGLSKNAE
jgi:hypothetical protein